MRLSTQACAAAVFSALAWLGACASPPGPPAATPGAGDPVEGRRLAEINCARCHAIGATGESAHAMAPPFRTLSRNYPVNALEEAFAEGVLVGHPIMPEFRLEPAQIEDLLNYIQSVQEQRAG
jgi:mono/diheme cytochrome c family protein